MTEGEQDPLDKERVTFKKRLQSWGEKNSLTKMEGEVIPDRGDHRYSNAKKGTLVCWGDDNKNITDWMAYK